MFKNYLVTAFRSLMRQKMFALINIAGLAIGLAASLLILLFVRYELSYESWLSDADQVYRVSTMWKGPGGEVGAQAEWVPGPLRQAMIEHIPEVDEVVRVRRVQAIFKRGDVLFNETVSGADSNFFEVFNLEFIMGESSRVLLTPNTIAISEQIATKYFGGENPIGQTILVDNEDVLEVVGVFKDLPENTELNFDIIRLFAPSDPFILQVLEEWNSQILQIYFTLKDGAHLSALNANFDNFLISVIPDDTPETPVTDNYSLIALSIADAHLYGSTGSDFMPGSGIKTVITFSMVAMLVVAVAIFNFVNSSTAYAELRAKEVAMRKVLGAGCTQLMWQFLSESALLCLFAFIVALMLVEMAMPGFRIFLDKPIQSNYFTDPLLFAGLLMVFPLVVLGSGYYPAIYLSKFRPARTLMSNQSAGGNKAGLRNILVLMQFSVSIGLAIVATIIHMQFDFATNRDLGFEKENKIILRDVGSDVTKPRIEAFERELERLPGVRGMVRSFYAIGDNNNMGHGISADWIEGGTFARTAPVDFGYFDLYQVPIIAGRSFDRNRGNDSFNPPEGSPDDQILPASVVINRAALPRLEIASAEEAIGKTFILDMGNGSGQAAMTIIGVVEDFREKNIRQSVQPTTYFIQPRWFFNATISLEPGSLPGVMEEIQQVWLTHFPDVPLRYQMLDEKMQGMYASEKRRSGLLYAFAMLAIAISAMGLYGLASFTAVRRTKEVGIRKVFGASSLRITGMMIQQFSRPVLLANLVAWPVAWYFMQDWLTGFSYRIEIEPSIFLGIGFGALALSWLTVGTHAWRVSRASLVHALRCE